MLTKQDVVQEQKHSVKLEETAQYTAQWHSQAIDSNRHSDYETDSTQYSYPVGKEKKHKKVKLKNNYPYTIPPVLWMREYYFPLTTEYGYTNISPQAKAILGINSYLSSSCPKFPILITCTTN